MTDGQLLKAKELESRIDGIKDELKKINNFHFCVAWRASSTTYPIESMTKESLELVKNVVIASLHADLAKLEKEFEAL